jgi:O-antigen/teichoic acid export membrane protein
MSGSDETTATATPTGPPPQDAPTSDGIALHVARGALLSQVSQVWGTGCMLVMATVLARELRLTEFGVYGLFVSVAGYVLIVQLSIEGAAVRGIAAAPTPEDRERVFSTALVLYMVAGVFSGLLIAALGLVLAGALGIPNALRPSARVGILILASLTAVGWPAKVFQDLLRGTQLFGVSALGEMLAYTIVSAGVVTLTLAHGPLSLIIGLGGGLSAMIGVCCLVASRAFGVVVPFRWGAANRATARELFDVSKFLLISGLADLVVYSMDRVILAAFRGAGAVGLYEGAVRPQNLLRQLHGTLVLIVSPVAAGLGAAADHFRSQQLMIRGIRYVMAIVNPVAVVLMTMSGPILQVWLGPKYLPAAGPLTILSSYWLIAGNSGVVAAMLLAVRRVRPLATIAWIAAIGNLLIALPLTPVLGLTGTALGITVPQMLALPWLIRLTIRQFDVDVGALARGAWLPAGVSSAALATFLLAARAVLHPHTLPVVAALVAAGLAAVFASYWVIWFDPSERELVLSLARRRGGRSG